MAVNGHLRPRQKVLQERVFGKIVEWKGKFGWISPSKPIDHQEAAKKGGKVYLSIQDVEAEIDGVGSMVSFFVYADGTGLGAMNVRPDKGAARPAKGAAKLPSRPPPWESQKPPARPKRKEGGGGGGYKPEERESFDEQPRTGTIQSFRGRFGFITPDEPIDDPSYKGKLYLACEDVDDPSLLKHGVQVSFTLYKDGSGLGADNCTVDQDALSAAAEKAPQTSSPAAARAAPAKPSMAPGKALKPKVEKARATPYSRPAGGAASGGGGPRKRISELELTGEVVEWAGGRGMINLYDTLDHPAAEGTNGRVRVLAKDVKFEGDKKSLDVGQLVQFHIYQDGGGLGAEEVLPFA